MDKLKFRRSGIQARVLALTMFFTLGASLVIAASNMHQMTAEWERTTIDPERRVCPADRGIGHPPGCG